VSAGNFQLLAGEPERFRSSESVTRQFCRRCGTQLTWQTDTKPALLTPGAPLLVSSPQLRVQVPFGIEHIVVAATQSPPVGLMRLAGRRVGPDSQLRPDLERIIQDAERAGAKASLRFQTVESGVSSP